MKEVTVKLGDGIREAVFGANDGAVSTFGILAGLVGAGLGNVIIIVVGVVQIFAAGMSMGLGAYISTKSQNEYFTAEAQNEEREIDVHPAKEKKIVEGILHERGLSGKTLTDATTALTNDKKHWLHFLVEERLGIAATSYPNPVFAGLIMFIAFLLAGFVVVFPFFLLDARVALVWSAFLSLSLLFFVGSAKTRFTHRNPWMSGFENLFIGLLTGVVGFLVGLYVKGFI